MNKAHAVLTMIDTWPIPDPSTLTTPPAEKPVNIGGIRVGEFVTLEVAAVLGNLRPRSLGVGGRRRRPAVPASVDVGGGSGVEVGGVAGPQGRQDLP
ncbi:MAG: hypothetical protein LKI24_08810 [Acidipropionibacterium sp.]|nr:hypothetical protein [Acidipropionibacterium sp.]